MPNLSHSPDTFDQFLGLIQAQHDMINKVEGLIVPRTPIDPGAFLDEYNTQPSSPLVLQLSIDRPALITKITFSYTPIAAATLVIGPNSGQNRNIPIPASITAMPVNIDCAMIVYPKDQFILTCAGATTIYIEVMGNLLSGTDWSVI